MRDILVPLLIAGASASRSNSSRCRLSPLIAQDVEFGSVHLRGAGQNATQAVQDGFYRGLIGQGAGRIQQSSISIFGAPHDLGAPLPQLGYILLSTACP